MNQHWTAAELPDLTGRTAVVTGASRDLGRMIVQRLSEHGAIVYAISRDEISKEQFHHNVEPVRMNPTSMDSIQNGAEQIRAGVDHLDILIHAASLSIAPRFRTAEGDELMFATNYLGFVMLTHALSPAMRASPSPRIVLADSGNARTVDMDIDRLDGDDLPWDIAYAQSRLAAMMFALELSTRALEVHSPLISAMGQMRERERVVDAHHPIRRNMYDILGRVYRIPPDAPTHPVLFASTADQARGGDYYAPWRHGQLRIDQIVNKLPGAARNPALRTDLWQRTEHMLGIHIDVA